MELITIITSTITAIIGAVGGGIGLFFWRENKRSKQIDNELKEADEWRKLYCEAMERNAEKSKRMKELFAEIDTLKTRAARAEFECEKLQWHKCVVNGCPNRMPPHNHEK